MSRTIKTHKCFVRICPTCGRTFKTNQYATRYCSEECVRLAAKRRKNLTLEKREPEVLAPLPEPEPLSKADSKPHKCRFCGREFIQTSKLLVYCSESCRLDAKRYMDRNLKFPADGGPDPDKQDVWKANLSTFERVCPICGNKFTTGIKNKKFCSKKCSNINTRNMSRESRKKKCDASSQPSAHSSGKIQSMILAKTSLNAQASVQTVKRLSRRQRIAEWIDELRQQVNMEISQEKRAATSRRSELLDTEFEWEQ